MIGMVLEAGNPQMLPCLLKKRLRKTSLPFVLGLSPLCQQSPLIRISRQHPHRQPQLFSQPRKFGVLATSFYTFPLPGVFPTLSMMLQAFGHPRQHRLTAAVAQPRRTPPQLPLPLPRNLQMRELVLNRVHAPTMSNYLLDVKWESQITI